MIMRRGQALLEYVLSLAGVVVVFGILWTLTGTAVRYAVRTEKLLCSDYP